jgi:hypothetical protein
MKKLAGSIIWFAILVACAGGRLLPGDNYTVHVDPAFGDKIPDVVAGLEEWENVAHAHGVKLHFDVVIDDRYCENYCPSEEFALHPNTTDLVPAFDLGLTEGDPRLQRSDAYVDSNITDPIEWSTCLKHEVGHCIGLHHTGAGTIMYPGWGDQVSRTVACADIQQVAQVRKELPPTCP